MEKEEKEQLKIFKVRDKRNKGWFFVDNEYLNGYAKIFGVVGTAIYVSLCRHADNESQKCWPSQEQIAEELSIGISTIRKYLRLFEKYHIISCSRMRDIRTKKWLHNEYTLADKTEWIKPSLSGGGGKPSLSESKSHRHLVAVHKETHNNKTHKLSAGADALHLEVKELFDSYLEGFKKYIKSDKPLFNWGACEKLAKPLIRQLGLPKMKSLLYWYFNCEDPKDEQFYKQNVWSLSCFLSVKTINKLNLKYGNRTNT